jgi:hypothetical protein
MRQRFVLAVVVVAGAGAVVAAQLGSQPSLLRNHPAIAYGSTTPDNPIERLDARLAAGEVALDYEPVRGYLRSVLEALDVPIDSQVLVFSKTSLQAAKIGPSNPRAIFFNDGLSVGFVRTGDLLEFVVQDPRIGGVFYTMTQTPGATPRFRRDDSCVACHTFDTTLNVPGMFVGSVFPGRDGMPQYASSYTTDHRSPFWIRWGGWYVTGQHGIERHMANAVVTDARDMSSMVTPETLRVTSLEGRFDMEGYLSPHSDVVALLVLEHQARMSNLITRVGWEARIGDQADRPLEAAATEFVDYLLFVDEEPLPGPIVGTTAFAATFPGQGPRDRKGRSLRDLDLDTRLLQYPCSYMIYHETFDALPDEAREAIYQRLWDVLTGRVTGPRYERLRPEDRAAILEILRDTKDGLPDYWLAVRPHASHELSGSY